MIHYQQFCLLLFIKVLYIYTDSFLRQQVTITVPQIPRTQQVQAM